MRDMKTITAVCAAMMCAAMTRAQESQTVYDFLRLPVSAHATALGGDNITLIEDDASLIFGNPALLSSVSDKTIGLSYMNYMAGVNMAGASFSRVAGQRASWAATAQYIDYGTMKEVDENNVQTGEFTAKDISVAGYFSYMLTDKLSGGVSAKLIASYIGGYNSMAVGVDLGLNYYDSEREWSLSLVAKNLGGQINAYDDDYEKLPVDVQLGASKQLAHTPFRFSATLVDLCHWNYRFINHLAAGVEARLSSSIWVGAGYNFRRANEMSIYDGEAESSHGAGWTLGAGLDLERFNLNLAYGKYHVSSCSLVFNVAYRL